MSSTVSPGGDLLGDVPPTSGDRITRRRGFAVQSYKPPDDVMGNV